MTVIDPIRLRYISEDWPGVPAKLYVQISWRLNGLKRYERQRTEDAIYYTPVLQFPPTGDSRDYNYTELIDPNPPGTPAHWFRIVEVTA